jgi:hypothetical protein
MAMRMVKTVSAVLVVGLATACAFGQAGSTSALLNEALDKQVNLVINGVLPQAMSQIADETGVRIEADPLIWDLLPWGDQTNITATIQNKTLRESLRAITQKLGLTFVLRENAVEIQPVPALTRVGRRATLDELELLDLLSSQPFRMDNARPTLRQVLDAVDGQLAKVKKEFAVEIRVPQGPIQETLIPVPRNATLADALEAIPRSTGMTWYPWAQTVVVLPKGDQIRALLGKKISLNLRGDDVGQVLLDLSRLTGVPFSIEPGAVQRVPPEFRSVRLVAENAPVQQVLEQLAATTGLGYVVSDKVGTASGVGGGVYIWNNSPIPSLSGAGPEPQPPRSRISLLVPLPGGQQMVLPEADLPEDVQEYLRSVREAEIRRLREQMNQDRPAPSTRPG